MCTRAFNNLNENFLTTARNMDWSVQLPTSLFTFKEGLQKSGMPETDSSTLTWDARYDSVVTMVGNADNGYAASDGINSTGLVANVLYDSEASYLKEYGSSCKQLSVLRWVQFVLDTCCSVAEVTEIFRTANIQIMPAKVPSSPKEAALHLSVSDIFGNSAIIEVIKGEFIINESKQYKIMTNEPGYKTQILLNQYWRWQWSDENSFPSHTIPGGPFPTDRFERASFYLNHLKSPESMDESLAQSKSITANASVPIGFNLGVGDHPNIAPTLWSTLANQNDKIYYFSNARTPNTIWVDLNEIGKLADASMLELVTEEDGEFENASFIGSVNDELTPTNDPYKLSCSVASNTL
jgi:penicillin V acylase-like amidase (Ntn superfamily)